jgi:hypothetical protein
MIASQGSVFTPAVSAWPHIARLALSSKEETKQPELFDDAALRLEEVRDGRGWMMATLMERPTELDASRFVFDGVSWDDYEAMLRIVGDRPIRVTYDRGRMEIMSPLWRQGNPSYLTFRAYVRENLVPRPQERPNGLE